MGRGIYCGRLIVMNDGDVKIVSGTDGGGTRFCSADLRNASFEQIHHRLRTIFEIKKDHRTTLFDFRCRPIDFRRYRTLAQYLHERGLTGKMRVIYLGTDAGRWRMMMKDKRRMLPRMKSIRNKHRRSSRVSSHRIDDRSHHHTNTHLDLGYSFKGSIEKLVKNIRALISNNGLDEILMQLHEYICTIFGYVCSTVNFIEQYFPKSADSSTKFYSNSLKNINEICQSVQTLLDCNNNRFAHVQLYSIIKKSFTQFDQKFKILHNRWLENNEIHTQTSRDKPIRSTTICNVFKPFSSFRISTNEEPTLFQSLLRSLGNFSNFLRNESFVSFDDFIQSIINDIKSLQSEVNLSNRKSLSDTEAKILSIKNELNKEFYGNSLQHKFNNYLYESLSKIFQSIELLLKSLDYYQLQADQNDLRENSNWSSPPAPFIHQSPIRIDDDQSSMGTRSTVDDEILFISATNAFNRLSC